MNSNLAGLTEKKKGRTNSNSNPSSFQQCKAQANEAFFGWQGIKAFFFSLQALNSIPHTSQSSKSRYSGLPFKEKTI